MFRPTDSFHSSLYPHFESLQSCYVHLSHCPCLCAVTGYAPNRRFCDSSPSFAFRFSLSHLLIRWFLILMTFSCRWIVMATKLWSEFISAPGRVLAFFTLFLYLSFTII